MVRRKRHSSNDSADDKQNQDDQPPKDQPVEAADGSGGTDDGASQGQDTRKRKSRRRSRRGSRGGASRNKENILTATSDVDAEDPSTEIAAAQDPQNEPTARKKTKKKTTKKVVKKTAKKTPAKKADKKTSTSRSRQGSTRYPMRRMSIALPEAESGPTPGDRVMLVNEVPGHECRIAILDDRRLDEYFVERASSATVVGNIYKARVTNIEAAIQAAFVDFGLGESGFLHVSDLHPQYFPGSDIVEQVGKKIPRRQRPPIQESLKKGQEILIQVLKQGIGSKGPTITSYLSIPGRLIVMMPEMDRVGISRKVADDEQRREMRNILESLDLPDKFGFIVRTAGFDASKTELKRDVAYLKRLWQQMDRRNKSTGAPCLLYAESDLLIRTIRDVVDTSVKTIVIDDPEAFERASAFLKVSSPRSAPEVRFFDRSMPIFSAFDVERQIEELHGRTVPLKSGGALVIEQTEALVAIDVNSGRSRSARDSETNAFETNKEAVDEICRQLRLRDLGGVIINDLIDMRMQRNRSEIETRIMHNLKRDRAKSTVLPISEFGIVEMTRQRMRPNTWRANYEECPSCSGSGELPRADAVASDALRRVAVLLEHVKTKKVEMVCSNRVASLLTETRKVELTRLEQRSGKSIAIRVSEKITDDRLDVYAYDESGSDLDISRIPRFMPPDIEELPAEVPDDFKEGRGGSRKKRRRRRGKTAPADATAIALSGGFDITQEEEEEEDSPSSEKNESAESEGTTTKKKRRRRRGGRGRKRGVAEEAPTQSTPESEPEPSSIRIYTLARELGTTSRSILDRCTTEGGFDLKNHMSSVAGEELSRIKAWFTESSSPTHEETPAAATDEVESSKPEATDGTQKRRKRRRRGRRGRGRGEKKVAAEDDAPAPTDESIQEPGDEGQPESRDSGTVASDEEAPRKRRRRRRGGRGRRKKGGGQENGSDQTRSGDDSTPQPNVEVPEPEPALEPVPEVKPALATSMAKKPRTLYGGRMRLTGR